ncbi:HNH endonuclease [Halorientalis salina]|uniref:HNH endonuclease n=1 Tax=Halorientalis salina TaxID=2932266 RepID=UPI0010AD83CD|nr:HNH endonuclease signature motif containing protein [Halorientalis salina]
MSVESDVDSEFDYPDNYTAEESFYGDGLYPPDWDRRRSAVQQRDDWTCQRCGKASGPHAGDDGVTLQCHHKQPIMDGGTNHLSNLEMLCIDCYNNEHDHDITAEHPTQSKPQTSTKQDSGLIGALLTHLILGLIAGMAYVFIPIAINDSGLTSTVPLV